MTAQEQQDFNILSLMKDIKTPLTQREFINLTEELVGSGFILITEDLKRRGLINEVMYQIEDALQGVTEYRYEISKAGIAAYTFLKEQKSKDGKIYRIVLWTLIAAVIGAIAAIIVPILLQP